MQLGDDKERRDALNLEEEHKDGNVRIVAPLADPSGKLGRRWRGAGRRVGGGVVEVAVWRRGDLLGLWGSPKDASAHAARRTFGVSIDIRACLF